MICGGEFRQISGTHLRKHSITTEEYMRRFPGAVLWDDELRAEHSKKMMGIGSAFKGMTYDEIYGPEKAAELRAQRFCNVDRHRFTGKTYEEMYGAEKAAELKELRSRKNREGGGHFGGRCSYTSHPWTCPECGFKGSSRAKDLHAFMKYKMSIPSEREALADRRRKFLQDNPEVHPNRILSGMNTSLPQMCLFTMIKCAFPEQEILLDFPVRTNKSTRYVDVAFPEYCMGLEYDGEYWHRGEDGDRDGELLEVGWDIHHFSGWEELKELERILFY